jgi:hypothetical protein
MTGAVVGAMDFDGVVLRRPNRPNCLGGPNGALHEHGHTQCVLTPDTYIRYVPSRRGLHSRAVKVPGTRF